MDLNDMPTEVHTICFHTRDAVEREDSRFVFEMPQHRMRNSAMKVVLGSVEFPMVQWTIEKDWNRLYVNEGVRLSPECNDVRVILRPPGKSEMTEHVVGVPPRLNRVIRTVRREGGIEVTCEHPHHLWALDGSSLLKGISSWGGDVRLVGDVDVSLSEVGLSMVSDTSFLVTSSPCANARYVHCSTLPSPRHLCDALTVSARGLQPRIRFQYDAAKDEVHVDLRDAEVGTIVRFVPTPLACAMGVSSSVIRADTIDFRLPSGPTSLWDHIEIPPGFYGPCHRPMCTGQPMRFGTETEGAVNRFYFPLPQGDDRRLGASPSTPHLLVFVDPSKKTHCAGIPCGRYTPDELCRHLESEMSRISGYAFSVAHVEDKFSFSCETRGRDGRVVETPFSLLFHHPLSTESERFGFPAQPLVGSATYTAPECTHVPRTDVKGTRTFGSILRLSEIAAQKRFRIHSAVPPTITAIVVKTDGRTSILRTHVNGLPYAHGHQPADVVCVGGAGGSVTFLEPTDSTMMKWHEVSHEGAESTPRSVVVGEAPEPWLLTVDAALEEGRCYNVTCAPEPFGMCFGGNKTQAIDAYMLGFPRRAVLWGDDGSVHNGHELVPPFDAPHVHCLDHPDYVLITLNESSGATLEHSYNGESKHVFCKLSLYPLFREERMLPRETTLSRSTFSRFEIAFWNPDMRRPYKFHGAEFSFSLSFATGVPGE